MHVLIERWSTEIPLVDAKMSSKIIFRQHANYMHRNDVINNLSRFFVTREWGEPIFGTDFGNHKISVMRIRFSPPPAVSACFTWLVGNDVEGFALLRRRLAAFNRNALRVPVRVVGEYAGMQYSDGNKRTRSAITVVFVGSRKTK